MVLGCLQILKEMPGHEKALKKLKEQFKEEDGHKGD